MFLLHHGSGAETTAGFDWVTVVVGAAVVGALVGVSYVLYLVGMRPR